MCSDLADSSNWLQLRPPRIRISYIVFRISRQKKQREKNVGLEAESSASCGGRMSAVNDRETGRVRGKSEAIEEKESQSLRQLSKRFADLTSTRV